MVTGDYHYTATSVARQVGMIPTTGKVVIIQAESEFLPLHLDSHLSDTQHEAHPLIQSPSLNQAGWGGGRVARPSCPSPPPQHSLQTVGADDVAHARELQTPSLSSQHSVQLRKGTTELDLSTTARGQQQLMGQPLQHPQGEAQGAIGQVHGWRVQLQVGGAVEDEGPAQGSASLQGDDLQSHPRDHQRLGQASASPRWHPQEFERALWRSLTGSQRLYQEAPGHVAGDVRHMHSSELLQRPAQNHGGTSFPPHHSSTPQQQSSESPQWQRFSTLIQRHSWHPDSSSRHPQPLSGDPQATAGHPQLPAGRPWPPAGHPEKLCHGLSVSLEGKERVYRGESALQPLTSVAQGQAQCCVTGPAFAHMLEQADLSMLHMVLHNVVVFARMQSHQKGQIMELLGTRGLHQVLDGQQRHIQVATLEAAHVHSATAAQTGSGDTHVCCVDGCHGNSKCFANHVTACVAVCCR